LKAEEASTEAGTSNLIMNVDFLIFLSLKHCRIYCWRGNFVALGLVRRSKYEELQRQRDELEEQVKILTGEIKTLRKEVAELRKEKKNSRRKISQLQEEANKLRVQKEELGNSVDILTKERGLFQKTIRNLSQATRKRKKPKKRTSF
jgi:prefoldin subunit 5